MDLFRLSRGSSPLLVSMPHVGTYIPPELAARMTDAALVLADTDWHVDRLYDFLDGLGASVLCPTHSRYVVDLNRPPDGANLYPGQDTTALVPLDTFAREPLYRPGEAPDEREIAGRVTQYWRPYHDALQRELERIRAASSGGTYVPTCGIETSNGEEPRCRRKSSIGRRPIATATTPRRSGGTHPLRRGAGSR